MIGIDADFKKLGLQPQYPIKTIGNTLFGMAYFGINKFSDFPFPENMQ